MKHITLKYIYGLIAICGLMITSCTSTIGNNDESSKEGKEYTSAYVCPMHCENSGSDTPGVCPVCGMDLVKNPDHPAHSSSKDEPQADHSCPMHADVTGVQGDTCSICGMDLEPIKKDHHDDEHMGH